jgi:hypothetical protein
VIEPARRPELPYVATLQYSETLVRAAVFAFWRRTVGAGYFVALALLVGVLGFLLYQGDRSWLVGALGAIVLGAIGFALLVYLVHLRASMARFRSMGAPNATLSLDEGSFTMTSGLGSTSLQWSAVTELWRFPSFWMLLFSRAQFVTIPLAAMPPEAQAFLRDRVSAAGGKVDD